MASSRFIAPLPVLRKRQMYPNVIVIFGNTAGPRPQQRCQQCTDDTEKIHRPFLVAQVINWAGFGVPPTSPILVGGVFISGAIVVTFWQSCG
jgi:hypothetical protein